MRLECKNAYFSCSFTSGCCKEVKPKLAKDHQFSNFTKINQCCPFSTTTKTMKNTFQHTFSPPIYTLLCNSHGFSRNFRCLFCRVVLQDHEPEAGSRFFRRLEEAYTPFPEWLWHSIVILEGLMQVLTIL